MIKRVWLFLFLISFVSFVSLAGASLDVYNVSFKTNYSFQENIQGKLNLSVMDFDFTSLLSSNRGDEISFGDFLMANGVSPVCFPSDCGSNYEIISTSTSKKYSLTSGVSSYGGFVLEGNNVHISGLSFNIQSDSPASNTLPLSINFFEGSRWNYNEFSDEFSAKFWGCYNEELPTMGPLIRSSSYCEKITLFESGAYFVGAQVGGSDTKELRMAIYPGEGGSIVGECLFNPLTKEGCRIDAEDGETFSGGEYKICVSSEDPSDSTTYTNYKIYTEAAGDVCGFVYTDGPLNSVIDYGIFGRVAKYSGGALMSADDFDFEGLASAADSLLRDKYNRNCSEKCVLPFSLIGIKQNLTISNVVLDYVKTGGDYVSDKVSLVTRVPATVDFKGVLDLELTGFNISRSGRYLLSLDDEVFVNKNITLLSVPLLTSFSPLNPPARVPIGFVVGVDFNSNASLTFTWNFGNGTVKTTSSNSVVHTFPDLKNYSVSVKVSAGGNATSEKNFVVTTISPKVAVNATLLKKIEAVNSVSQSLLGFPSWYSEKIGDLIELDVYINELNRLKGLRDRAYEEKDFLSIATDLYALIVPTEVFFEESFTSPLLTDIDDINPSVIDYFAGGADGVNFGDYKDPILRWQSYNIQSTIESDKISSSWWDGEVRGVMRRYKIDVEALDYGESYFVINRPIEELYFKDFTGAKRSENATIIPLNEGEPISFEFYSIGEGEVTFFASPRLTQLVLEGSIDESCNRNFICDKDLGENYENCRSDCKPVGWAIFYVVSAIFLVAVIYLLLQIWYKRRYENYLFGDRRHLYNLLMYITNARARGVTDIKIKSDLIAQGWSNERIIYVIKKSRGERTGMYELFPLESILAYFRNRTAQKNIATRGQQQNRRNINKSDFQGRPIR